ncbi:hypothetical protein BCON_0165g00090 [Botryotinia convoluta]|uniref:C2H2-type domain-containing protein n=1 Tax=Botryotinia convoluta TaxID=54673 RepID=A0A4Z1HQ85_9HELO|nr:hypothetical protein BCON_0165g00090 [Botryotinia convoluta]
MSLYAEPRQAPGDSIVEIARNVATVFARGRAKQLEPHLRSELENELGRFKIWAGNLGVFAPGRASVDYRLRDDADVKEILIQMLGRLRQSTKQAMDPPVILEEEAEEESGKDDSSATSSEDSMAISLDTETDAGYETDDLPSLHSADVVATALNTIKDTITRLYRLSTIIKKPSSANENVKVANFIAKDEVSAELAEFQTSVRWQIEFRLPDASLTLLNRLVEAAVFRRRKLEYRKRHKEKLKQGVERSFASDLVLPLIPKDTVIRQAGAQHRGTPILRQQASSARGSISTMQYSATEASSVNRLKFASYPKSVAISGITRSAVARREQLDIPAPPSKSEGEVKEAICPYCFRIVDKEEMIQARWKRHVLRDIEPYVCLFDGCNKSTEYFATVEDWVNHMQWQHAVVWCCQVPGHESTVYRSEEEFKHHLREEHKNAFNETQLSMIVKKASQPVSDLFASSALASNGNENESHTAGACPLCPFSVDIQEHNASPGSLEVAKASLPVSKELCDHIAAHMEAIALLSLPERDDLDDAKTNERQSENTYHSLDQDTVDSPPIASIIENDDDEISPDHAHNSIGPTSSEFTSRGDWNYILEDKQVKSRQDPEPARDPTLQKFVRRARRDEMFRRWKIDRVPPIVLYDPDGIETSPIIDGTQAYSMVDEVPDMFLSNVDNFQPFIEHYYSVFQNHSQFALAFWDHTAYKCCFLDDYCQETFRDEESLQIHFETSHFKFTRIDPCLRTICTNCLTVGFESTCNCGGDVKLYIVGNYIRDPSSMHPDLTSTVRHTSTRCIDTTGVPDSTDKAVMEEADRAYRERIRARRIAEEGWRSPHSVLDKYRE